VERLEDPQALGMPIELNIADQHVDVGSQSEGVIRRLCRADEREIASRLDGGRHGGEDRRVIIDDADADPGCGVVWIGDGRFLGIGAERHPTSMAGVTRGGIPWKHATPGNVPVASTGLGEIFTRGPLWLFELPETAGNCRIRLDS
jgi:hypothetical protein